MRRAISKLSMLAGHWQGAGWASSPDGQRHEFEQTEEIHLKLDGIALLIQGIGKDKESGEVIHLKLDGIAPFNRISLPVIRQMPMAILKGNHLFGAWKSPAGQFDIRLP